MAKDTSDSRGFDLALRGAVARHTLRAAVAVAYGLSADRVAVVDDVGAGAPDDVDVLVELRAIGGEFGSCASIYPRGVGRDAREIAQRGVDALEVSALMGDDDPNPYVWLLFEPGASVRRVAVDVDALNERGWLVMIRD